MQAAFKEMTLAPGAWFKALFTKMIAHILYYAIPFFSFLALRINLGYENFDFSLTRVKGGGICDQEGTAQGKF